MAVNNYTFDPSFMVSGCFGGGSDISSVLQTTLYQSGAMNSIPEIGQILSGVNSVEMVISGDAQQKTNGIQSLISNIMNLIGTNETSEASSEVSKNNQDSNKIVNLSREQQQKLESSMNAAQEGIETEKDNIQAQQKEAENLQKELEDKQKDIQDKLAAIQAEQQALAAETDPEEQQKHLDTLQKDLVPALLSSIEAVGTLKSQLDTISKSVKESFEKINGYSSNAETAAEEGSKSIQQLAGEASEVMQSNSQTDAKAPINAETSKAAATKAAALSSNPITAGTLAPKLYSVATDQGVASGIRKSGAATVWAQMIQGIGNLNCSVEMLSSFENTIGSALNDCATVVGEWNTTVTPMITGFGSADALKEQVGEFDSMIKEDQNTVKVAMLQPIEETPENNNNKKLNPYLRAQLLGNENYTTESNYKNNLLTPKAQLKFGI